MKKLILFSLLIIPVFLAAQTPVPPGPVSGTWDLAGSPYMVNGEIYIHEDSTLIIEPGVEVRFTGWYKFIVNGSLLAEGTDADQILFTADNTNNPWYGIRFMYATGTSVLDHCIVEYGQTMLSGGGSWVDPAYLGGGILGYKSPVASITIKNSIIRNNVADYGGGIELTNTYPLIENCEIVDNEAYWGGGVDARFMSAPAIIKNSVIAFNVASSRGGGISAGAGSNLEIIACEIKNNSAQGAAGIQLNTSTELIVTGNTIAKNHATSNGGGIGIWYADTIGTFKDNTIVYNHAEDGGGVFIGHNCSPSFESDILYFNTSGSSGPNQVHLNTTGGAPFFNYCDVQDSCTGFSGNGAHSFPSSTHFLNCIDANPLFADAANDDFNLTWTNYPIDDDTKSPCIDAGMGSSPLGVNGANDIGALEYDYIIETPVLSVDTNTITSTSFLAEWNACYGAVGYYLDMALDEGFDSLIYSNIDIIGDTTYMVENLTPSTYYCRVNSYNSGVSSPNSNVVKVDLATSIFEICPDDITIYSSNKNVVVILDQKTMTSAECYIYDITGRLIVSKTIFPGSNVIDPVVSNQILILRVVIDGRIYHRKLYVH